jgi:hypothetical protein
MLKPVTIPPQKEQPGARVQPALPVEQPPKLLEPSPLASPLEARPSRASPLEHA